MVFLNPSILLGLLASAIPILIHLLNLRKLNRVEFSTLDFLKELQKNKIKKVKIKQWVLLLLRVLIILFIVLSFARPTLENTTLAGTSASSVSSVFIIDDSPSMKVIGDNGSYFNESKAMIIKLSDQFQDGDELNVITSSGKNSFKTSNISNLKEFIESLEPTDISSGLNESLNKAAGIISETDNFNKELYVFTDKQKNIFEEDSVLTSAISTITENNARIYFSDFNTREQINTGLHNLLPENQIFEMNKPVKFSVFVTNYSSSPTDNIVASLFINDDRVARHSLSLKPGETEKVIFETTLNKTGFLKIRAELEDDDFESDNYAYTTLFVPEQINVITFYANESDLVFLSLALSDAVNSGAIKNDTRPISQAASVNLSDYNTIILSGVPAESNFERFSEYLNNGGGIIFFPPSGEETSPAAFLNTLGTGITNAKHVNSENGVSYDITGLDLQHPLFTNLFRENAKPSPQSPVLYDFYRFNVPYNVQKIIVLENDTPFLSEYKEKNGKLLFFNLSPALTASDFPLSGLFAPLVNKGIYYLSNTNENDTTYFAGETIPVNTVNFPYKNLRVEQPSGNSVYITADSVKQSSYLNFPETETTGIYSLYPGDELFSSFAVNINPAESDSRKLENNAITEIFSGSENDVIFLDNETNLSETISQARFGTELWRYFLIIALLLALTEMILARNSKKDLAEIS